MPTVVLADSGAGREVLANFEVLALRNWPEEMMAESGDDPRVIMAKSLAERYWRQLRGADSEKLWLCEMPVLVERHWLAESAAGRECWRRR